MATPVFVPLSGYTEYPPDEMLRRAEAFRDEMRGRRTVREFARRPLPPEVITACVEAAATAPNGANQQPWHFVVVSDPAAKRKIRLGAEEEEREFYGHRAPQEWLHALEPFGTDAHKPFLEDAPHLIVIFAEAYGVLPGGGKEKRYYAQESVGIATGILITALHRAGLATLTHTPSPMRFLNDILNRPANERPFLILVVGHPADDAKVPAITKKPSAEIMTFL